MSVATTAKSTLKCHNNCPIYSQDVNEIEDRYIARQNDTMV